MKTPCKHIVYELHISSILNAVYNAARGSFLDHGKQAQTNRRPMFQWAQSVRRPSASQGFVYSTYNTLELMQTDFNIIKKWSGANETQTIHSSMPKRSEKPDCSEDVFMQSFCELRNSQ